MPGTTTVDYLVFGLRLRSTAAVPGLVAREDSGTPDVWLDLDGLPAWIRAEATGVPRYESLYRNELGRPELVVDEVDGGARFLFAYEEGARFLLDRTGTRVWAEWSPPLTIEDVSVYLLGPILGAVLRLRGIVCLHASAVAIGDSAAAFVGPAGAGKSTTAGAFATTGDAILSDDVVTLDPRVDGWLVHPAYPHLKLWPHSGEILFGSADALPPLTPTWDKQYLNLTGDVYRFSAAPLYLDAVYLLAQRVDDPRAPYVEPIGPQAALVALIGNVYAGAFLGTAARADELRLLASVVSHVTVRRVVPHVDPVRLALLRDAIHADIGARHTDLPAARQ